MRKSRSPLNDSERTLFALDTVRQGADGFVDTLRNSVFLLVAIQFFQSPDRWNTAISTAPAAGMLAGLFITPFLESRFRPRSILTVMTLLMAAGLGAPLLIPGVFPYTVGVSLCLFVFSLRIPFLTGYYTECYRPDRRARLMSTGTLIMILVATGTSWLFGHLLDRNIGNYRTILLLSALLFAGNALSLGKLPPGVAAPPTGRPFWTNLSLIWKDPRFGIASFSWMILGFANLWSMPIRTVFLSDPDRGLGLDPLTVLLILGIIPGVVRLLSNYFWAHFYDKAPFVFLRMVMNFLIGLGIFIFFISRNLWLIGLGSVLINLSLAGAPYIWNLWVTRLAPPEEVRRYMSVHSFLCGIRGVAGHPLAFLFIGNHDIQTVGMISTVMAMISVIALFPLISRKLRF